jgi:radical SAM superfamily enzyme YgiQ (UPF0313 family)
MKVLLLTTPRPEQGDSPLHFGCGRPPQGLGYIAALLEQNGHETEIVDLYTFGGEGVVGDSTKIQSIGMQLDIDLDYKIKSFEPDYIGMYISTLTHINAYDMSNRLAKDYPHIPQVCGGPHVTLFPESVPDTFAYAVTGAGEYVMLNIVERNPLGGQRNSNGVFVIDGGYVSSINLKRLPWPDYDKFINLPYNFSLEEFGIDEDALILNTSRGCPFRCTFCAGKYVHPKYSCNTGFNVAAQMHKLYDKYGIKNFYFREDNFTASPKRLDEFCDVLLLTSNRAKFKWVCESRAKRLTPAVVEKMAKAGCVGLYIGCESGSDRVLKLMHKMETVEDYRTVFPILKANGINTYTTWMFGYPGETALDAHATLTLSEELEPTSADYFIFIGIPKSIAYNRMDSTGDYEYKDKYGFIFPHGYLDKATGLYGYNDPKVKYVREAYGDSIHTS